MFQIEELEKIVGKGNIKEKESLSAHTTFRIGGPADWYVEPETQEQLVRSVQYLRQESVPYVILGNGSNLLVSDDGFSGVVLATHGAASRNSSDGAEGLEEIRILEPGDTEREVLLAQGYCAGQEADGKTLVYAGSGILLSGLAAEIARKGLTGFEFASGIPGTLGGAVTMNAGAYGGEIKDVILGVKVLDRDGNVRVLHRDELELGYRHSRVQQENMIVLDALFGFNPGDTEEIRKTMRELNARRREKQPLEYGSAGSTFKRPEGYFAGKLIEDAGLKGYREGDVMVSDKHCGFVVNVGQGTCVQADQVIRHVQKTVKEQFGVSLELEVRRLP